jgi:hypothetical protein
MSGTVRTVHSPTLVVARLTNDAGDGKSENIAGPRAMLSYSYASPCSRVRKWQLL